MAKRVLSSKKSVLMITPAPVLQAQAISEVKPEAKPEAKQISPPLELKVRRVLGKPALPIPPIPGQAVHLTKAMEAFESIREYYIQNRLPMPQSDIKWYHEELAQEKKEYDEFWARCAVTKACIEGTLRGDDDWTITLAMNAAKQAEKKLPILESEIGEMPPHGTGEFWAWCRKRKLLKEQKEAAIIAAGGSLPKAKQPKAKKPKAQGSQ